MGYDPIDQPDPKPVKRFHEILFLPLYLDPGPRDSPSGDWLDAVDRVLIEKGSPWELIPDLLVDAEWEPPDGGCGRPPDAMRRSYSEFVYFHPFVQKLLYPRSDEQWPAVRMYRRTDVKRLCLKGHEIEVCLAVKLVWLFLFAPDIAILTLEIAAEESTGQPLSLAVDTVQRILDTLRRVYPPYWGAAAGGQIYGGHCLDRVELYDAESQALVSAEYADWEPFAARAHMHRVPAIAAHWRFLVHPLLPAGGGESGEWHVSQLGDDRAPLMAYIALVHPRRLSRADFVRLALADDPPGECFRKPDGASDAYPYAWEFLRNFETEYCYDRFWSIADGSIPLTTRYLNSGFAFVVVGDAEDNAFFTDEKTGALAHFRHHYFKMGLLAHLQRTSLLALSHRVAEQIRTKREGAQETDATFATEIESSYNRFLDFSHRYWFHEVSNQVQGQELFDLWQRRLRTTALYEETRAELGDAMQYIATKRQEEQTTQATDLAEQTARLTVVATVGLVLAVTSSILSMNVLEGPPAFSRWSHPSFAEGDFAYYLNWMGLVILVGTLVMVTVGFFLVVLNSRRIGAWLDRVARGNGRVSKGSGR